MLKKIKDIIKEGLSDVKLLKVVKMKVTKKRVHKELGQVCNSLKTLNKGIKNEIKKGISYNYKIC